MTLPLAVSTLQSDISTWVFRFMCGNVGICFRIGLDHLFPYPSHFIIIIIIIIIIKFIRPMQFRMYP